MKTALWVIVLAVASVVSAGAQDNPVVTVPSDSLIAARQATMKMQFALLGSIKRATAEGTDVKPFKDAGDAVAAWGKAIPGMFPVGSGRGHDTRALAVIWTERPGFEKAAAALTDAAQMLSKTAEIGDAPGFTAAFQAVGQACATCHRTYRAR